jgi:hypothetical protein
MQQVFASPHEALGVIFEPMQGGKGAYIHRFVPNSQCEHQGARRGMEVVGVNNYFWDRESTSFLQIIEFLKQARKEAHTMYSLWFDATPLMTLGMSVHEKSSDDTVERAAKRKQHDHCDVDTIPCSPNSMATAPQENSNLRNGMSYWKASLQICRGLSNQIKSSFVAGTDEHGEDDRASILRTALELEQKLYKIIANDASKVSVQRRSMHPKDLIFSKKQKFTPRVPEKAGKRTHIAPTQQRRKKPRVGSKYQCAGFVEAGPDAVHGTLETKYSKPLHEVVEWSPTKAAMKLGDDKWENIVDEYLRVTSKTMSEKAMDERLRHLASFDYNVKAASENMTCALLPSFAPKERVSKSWSAHEKQQFFDGMMDVGENFTHLYRRYFRKDPNSDKTTNDLVDFYYNHFVHTDRFVSWEQNYVPKENPKCKLMTPSSFASACANSSLDCNIRSFVRRRLK